MSNCMSSEFFVVFLRTRKKSLYRTRVATERERRSVVTHESKQNPHSIVEDLLKLCGFVMNIVVGKMGQTINFFLD